MTLLDLAADVVRDPSRAAEAVAMWTLAGKQGAAMGRAFWMCACPAGERINPGDVLVCDECGCRRPEGR